MAVVASVEELAALYGAPNENSTAKEVDWITPEYRRMIEASPFAALATVGPEGVDCSPRGDQPGFVRVHDVRTLMVPDRLGNNRVDSLANIVRDPRCALMFLIPGWGNALRVNGRAVVETDEALRASFAVQGRAPRSVIVMTVEAVYFQCARAIVRSRLWDPEARADVASLPTAGDILAAVTANRLGGEAYDSAWPERAAATLW